LVTIQCTTKLQTTPRHAAFPTDPQQNTETYRACPQKTGKTKTRSIRSEETDKYNSRPRRRRRGGRRRREGKLEQREEQLH
jgi:hypothetical protein